MMTREMNSDLTFPKEARVAWLKSKTPWYAPAWLIRKKMKDSVPDFEKREGLVLKLYTINPDSTFGGFYFWRDQTQLQSYYTPQRLKEIEEKRGAPPILRTFELTHALLKAIPEKSSMKLFIYRGQIPDEKINHVLDLQEVVAGFILKESNSGSDCFAILSCGSPPLDSPEETLDIPLVIRGRRP
jgi:hypothetical protein